MSDIVKNEVVHELEITVNDFEFDGTEQVKTGEVEPFLSLVEDWNVEEMHAEEQSELVEKNG